MNVMSNEFNCLCCKLLHCLAQKIDFLLSEHMFRKYGWNIFNISVWIYGPSNDSCTQHIVHPNIIPVMAICGLTWDTCFSESSCTCWVESNLNLVHCLNETQVKLKKGSMRGVPVLQKNENYEQGLLEKWEEEIRVWKQWEDSMKEIIPI